MGWFVIQQNQSSESQEHVGSRLPTKFIPVGRGRKVPHLTPALHLPASPFSWPQGSFHEEQEHTSFSWLQITGTTFGPGQPMTLWSSQSRRMIFDGGSDDRSCCASVDNIPSYPALSQENDGGTFSCTARRPIGASSWGLSPPQAETGSQGLLWWWWNWLIVM